MSKDKIVTYILVGVLIGALGGGGGILLYLRHQLHIVEEERRAEMERVENLPCVKIVEANGHDTVFPGLDYGFVVIAKLNNVGGPGSVLVMVYLREHEEVKWREERVLYFKRGEVKDVEFNFRQPKLFGGSADSYGIETNPYSG